MNEMNSSTAPAGCAQLTEEPARLLEVPVGRAGDAHRLILVRVVVPGVLRPIPAAVVTPQHLRVVAAHAGRVAVGHERLAAGESAPHVGDAGRRCVGGTTHGRCARTDDVRAGEARLVGVDRRRWVAVALVLAERHGVGRDHAAGTSDRVGGAGAKLGARPVRIALAVERDRGRALDAQRPAGGAPGGVVARRGRGAAGVHHHAAVRRGGDVMPGVLVHVQLTGGVVDVAEHELVAAVHRHLVGLDGLTRVVRHRPHDGGGGREGGRVEPGHGDLHRLGFGDGRRGGRDVVAAIDGERGGVLREVERGGRVVGLGAAGQQSEQHQHEGDEGRHRMEGARAHVSLSSWKAEYH